MSGRSDIGLHVGSGVFHHLAVVQKTFQHFIFNDDIVQGIKKARKINSQCKNLIPDHSSIKKLNHTNFFNSTKPLK